MRYLPTVLPTGCRFSKARVRVRAKRAGHADRLFSKKSRKCVEFVRNEEKITFPFCSDVL